MSDGIILGVKKWLHVTFTVNTDRTTAIYRDGVVVKTAKINHTANLLPNYGSCFIGKSQSDNISNIDAYIDDLWMFNRSLSSNEIQIVMSNSISATSLSSTKTTTASVFSTSQFKSNFSTLSTMETSISSSTNDKLMLVLSNMKLINHWNFDNNYLDLKSRAPLLIKNTSFVKDRFGNEKSAIAFNFGQMRIPVFFFRESFSILVWIFITQIDAFEQRLIHCDDQSKTNTFALTLQSGNNKNSYFSINNDIIFSKNRLPIKTWIQVGATLDSNQTVNMWYNGVSVSGEGKFKNVTKNLTWADCYIGYTSNNVPNLNLYLDDMMLFASDFTPSDINDIPTETS